MGTASFDDSETLSPFPLNPYTLGNPVQGEEFFGRESVFRDIEQYLAERRHHVIVLHGQRRIGKTSVLHQIANHRRPRGFHPVFFDLHPFARDSRDEVLFNLANFISMSLNMNSPERDKFDGRGDYFRQQFLPSIYASSPNEQLLILLDEFDVLRDQPLEEPEAAVKTFFPYLQRLINEEHRITFLLAIGRQAKDLPNIQVVFKAAPTIPLGLLSYQDTCDLITRTAAPHLQYAEEATNRIFELTAGHPFCIQELCYAVFRRVTNNNSTSTNVSSVDVDAILEDAIVRARTGIEWMWERLPALEHAILSAIADPQVHYEGATLEEIRETLARNEIDLFGIDVKEILANLISEEVLKDSRGQYGFVVDFIRKWVALEHSMLTAKQELRSARPVVDGLLQAGTHALRTGDLRTASQSYARVLAIQPASIEAILGQGKIRFQERNFEEALQSFEYVLSLDQAQVAEGSPRSDARRQEVEQAGVLLAKSALNLSTLRERERKHDSAAMLLERALDFLPNDRQLRTQLVELYLRSVDVYKHRRQYLNAERTLTKLLDLPYIDEAVKQLAARRTTEIKILRLQDDAKRFEESKQLIEALAAYNELIQLQPDSIMLPTWQMKTQRLGQQEATDKIYNTAQKLQQQGDWRLAAMSWFGLLGQLPDSEHPFYYEDENIPLLLAMSASRLRAGASSKPKVIYQDIDGVIRYDDDSDVSDARRYVIPKEFLGHLGSVFVLAGILMGIVLGVLLTLLFSTWAIPVAIVIAVLIVVVLRPRLTNVRERIQELKPVDSIQV